MIRPRPFQPCRNLDWINHITKRCSDLHGLTVCIHTECILVRHHSSYKFKMFEFTEVVRIYLSKCICYMYVRDANGKFKLEQTSVIHASAQEYP